MLSEKEAHIGLSVWYYDDKTAKPVNTTIESNSVGLYRGEPSVFVISKKDPIQLKYLMKGHKETTDEGGANIVIPPNPNKEQSISLAPKEVKFMAKILDEHKEVEITPEIIREKSKELLALEINGIFDTAGAEKVKTAKNKAVKMRTAVEKLEKSYLNEIKAAADAAKKRVTDVSLPIYEACKEAENALQKKLDDHNAAVAEAAEKERKEREAITIVRDNKMFELGMLTNGTAFIGYGKTVAKEGLYAMDAERYNELVAELEALKMEADLRGEGIPMYQSAPMVSGKDPYASAIVEAGNIGHQILETIATYQHRPQITFPNTFKETVLKDGRRIVITEGTVEAEGLEIINDRIGNSKYYLQVI